MKVKQYIQYLMILPLNTLSYSFIPENEKIFGLQVLSLYNVQNVKCPKSPGTE